MLDISFLLTIDDCLFLIFDLKEKNIKPHELEYRLIDFAAMVIAVVEDLPISKAGNHIAGQLVRFGFIDFLKFALHILHPEYKCYYAAPGTIEIGGQILIPQNF